MSTQFHINYKKRTPVEETGILQTPCREKPVQRSIKRKGWHTCIFSHFSTCSLPTEFKSRNELANTVCYKIKLQKNGQKYVSSISRQRVEA